jgi:biopolymer transport protein ExbB
MVQLIQKGGPVMYPLLACSLIVLTLVIERGLFWLTIEWHRRRPLVDEVLELCRAGDWESVRRKTLGCKDFVVRVLVSGILHRDLSMLKAMEGAAADTVQRMRRFMGVLDTMITVAPLLGILGTVLGIISSFDMLGTAGIENPGLVTAGVAEALLTTAFGLTIAILSVIPYNYFNSRVERAVLDMEKYATSLEIMYEKLNREPCDPARQP